MSPVYLLASSDRSESIRIPQDLLPATQPDRGVVWKLCRDPITHHTAKHCSGHKMTSFPHFTLILYSYSRRVGGGEFSHRETLGCRCFKILHCYLHICDKNTYCEWLQVTMPLFIKSVGTVTAYVHGLSEYTNRWMRQHCHLQAQFCYNFTTAKEYSSYGYIFITI